MLYLESVFNRSLNNSLLKFLAIANANSKKEQNKFTNIFNGLPEGTLDINLI